MNCPHQGGAGGCRYAGLLMAVIALGSCCAVAAAPPDLSGIWQVMSPPAALLTVDGKLPPMWPAAQAIYDRRVAARAAKDSAFDPVEKCKPPGEPRIMTQSMPVQILQQPKQITFLYQWNHLVRWIAIAKTRRPPAFNTYFGDSIAQWVGEVLVVDVTGLNALTLMDDAGLPHSDALRLTERFRLVHGGSMLRVDLTVDDPMTFSSVWNTALRFRRLPSGSYLAEDDCEDRMGGLKDFY